MQRIAELTAEAEDNVSGIRIARRSPGRSGSSPISRHAVKRVFDQSMVSTRLRAFDSPLIGFLPQYGRPRRAVS